MKELLKNKNLIWELSKNDFKKRYAGSSLGRVWAFVQPLVTVVLYYFVFGLVFPGRSPYDSPVPYVMWLTAGLVPWFFLNEAVTTGANAMNEYNYLVKKVVFKVGILPLIKTISATFIHIFFIFVLLVMYFREQQIGIDIIADRADLHSVFARELTDLQNTHLLVK